MLKPIYKRLLDAQGIAGHETSIRKIMHEELSLYPSFHIRNDHLGSIFEQRKAMKKILMLSWSLVTWMKLG
jgi:putative aminopeptidase FrvX